MSPPAIAPPPAAPLLLGDTGTEAFALHHRPAGAARGAIVYVPPFTEEMNKSRRMAALQSRALAAAGWHVLQIDPRGTGDSAGDFGEATWDAWLDDVAKARQWLREASGLEPWLWGLRLGALLAAESARSAPAPAPAPGLLAWQPVVSGKQHLQQFLRIKEGADWVGSGRREAAEAKPFEQLQAGQAVEVAGYRLAPGLALPMAEARLAFAPGLGCVVWLEVSPRADERLSPAAERVLATAGGTTVHAAVVQGPGFWQALEIETAPALLEATLRALREAAA